MFVKTRIVKIVQLSHGKVIWERNSQNITISFEEETAQDVENTREKIMRALIDDPITNKRYLG